jgi:hypothetical protein
MVDRFGCVAGKRLRVKRCCCAFNTASVGELLDPRGEGDIRGALSVALGCRDGRDPRPSSSPEVEVEFLGPIYRAESEVSFQPPRVNPRWRSLLRVFEMPVS